MTHISNEDLIQSVADAFQYISYYHPPDFINAMYSAYTREQSPSAKDALAQILINSRMCAEGKRPICQDTGFAVVFIKVGMDVSWDGDLSIGDLINEGVRRAYTNPDNPLRASIVAPPVGTRTNTHDNTPAVIHYEMVTGDRVEVICAAKGGGSENKARFTVLNPNDDLVDWIVKTIPTLGAGWCPPGILGVGIGGTPEKAMLMAKESLMNPVDIHELQLRGAQNRTEKLRLELHQKINDLGIGAQGLGGLTTVLDVKIMEYPSHAASLPVAIIPNCAATRHIHFTLDGHGPAELTPPPLSNWPLITQTDDSQSQHVDLNTLTHEQTKQWHPGDTLLLSGKLLTGRDAAHKRIAELIASGSSLPDGVDLTNRFIYYVGPVDPIKGEAVGPAGPTTSTRMDKFTDTMLDHTGILGMIGKAERGPETIASIKQHKAVYLIATGGAAYLISKAIRSAKVVAFPELGMEAIYEFDVEDMPVTVAVDSLGASIHQSGPREWKIKIEDIKRHKK
ncbi:Fumarate hydratase class I, aerobic [hydrothermal vent metagenome]|uniref:fumarate hydratase n=1 Tax=hydrothermal vent metagenome TaxID=652676 RepID=A0A3B0Z6Z7_9ZZZZ